MLESESRGASREFSLSVCLSDGLIRLEPDLLSVGELLCARVAHTVLGSPVEEIFRRLSISRGAFVSS